MRHALVPLRWGSFRTLYAEPGSGMLAFARHFGEETVTVALNCSPDAAVLPDIPGTVYWMEGLEGRTLTGFGFAVLVDGRS